MSRAMRTVLPSWALTVGADPNVVAARASGLRWSRDALAALGYYVDDACMVPTTPSQFGSISEYIDFLREQHRTRPLL